MVWRSPLNRPMRTRMSGGVAGGERVTAPPMPMGLSGTQSRTLNGEGCATHRQLQSHSEGSIDFGGSLCLIHWVTGREET